MAEKNEPDETVGSDNTIPDSEDGVALGHGEASNFEPEEDEDGDGDAESPA